MNYEPLPQRILMGPGPSNVNARVLQALAMPTIGHLDPAFTQLMDETMEMLRGVFGTRNQLAFPMSGTGSAGMEACFVNALQPGDRVLVGVNGVFGERMCDVARRCGAEVRVDDWGVDLAYSGTQKCLSCPPGLAPVTFGERALAALDGRTAPVQSWYLDLSMIRRYWTGERFYHHTAPINMLYGLRESLRLIMEEGLAERVARHRRHADALWAGLEAMGMRLFVAPEVRLTSLTTVWLPEGAEDIPVRQALLRESNLEIGVALGATKGKVWRIGLMGEMSSSANVL